MTAPNECRADADYYPAHKRCRDCGGYMPCIEMDKRGRCADCAAAKVRINKRKQKGHANADRKHSADD